MESRFFDPLMKTKIGLKNLILFEKSGVKCSSVEWETSSYREVLDSITRIRGVEWSLRALASMRAVRLFLRARAVIKYVLRAASTLKLMQMASSNFLGGI